MKKKILIVVADYYKNISNGLLKSAQSKLKGSKNDQNYTFCINKLRIYFWWASNGGPSNETLSNN